MLSKLQKIYTLFVKYLDTKTSDFKTDLDDIGIQNEIYIYPGIGHAFANPSGVTYAPKETSDAWNKTISFLDKYLK